MYTLSETRAEEIDEDMPPVPVAWKSSLPKVVFVLGGPGAGKGTQCSRIVSEYGFVHLSAGDLLRAERDSGSPDGDMIANYIKEGKIVPVEVTVRLLERAMRKNGGSRFLIDGFPRNANNLEGWNSRMEGRADVEFVLFYDVDDETRLERLTGRSKTSGRTDDNAETIKKRFRVYEQETVPVVNLFAREGRARPVDASGNVDEVFEATRQAIEPVLAAQVETAWTQLVAAEDAGNVAEISRKVLPDATAVDQDTSAVLLDDGALPATSPSSSSSSTLVSTVIRILGPHSATSTGTRIVRTPGHRQPSRAFAETRVWIEGDDGVWRVAHTHRSKAGPVDDSTRAARARLDEAAKAVDRSLETSVKDLLAALRDIK